MALALMDQAAPAAVAVGIESPLCDGACVGALDQLKMVTTPSGLRYKDLVVGKGPLPTKGEPIDYSNTSWASGVAQSISMNRTHCRALSPVMLTQCDVP